MTSRERAKERVEKLVRLAVDEGATEAERASAAKRACEMIAEHQLLDAEVREAPREKKSRPRAEDVANAIFAQASAIYERATRPTPFRPARAGFDSPCGESSCGEPIYEGERCWSRFKNGQVEYVHADCWTVSEKP